MQLLENHMGGCMTLGNSKEMCRHLLIPAILVIRFPSRCALSSASVTICCWLRCNANLGGAVLEHGLRQFFSSSSNCRTFNFAPVDVCQKNLADPLRWKADWHQVSILVWGGWIRYFTALPPHNPVIQSTGVQCELASLKRIGTFSSPALMNCERSAEVL